jgi:hypothetical protein
MSGISMRSWIARESRRRSSSHKTGGPHWHFTWEIVGLSLSTGLFALRAGLKAEIANQAPALPFVLFQLSADDVEKAIRTSSHLQPRDEMKFGVAANGRKFMTCGRTKARGLKPGFCWAVELGCRYPRTCVLGNVQPSLRDWSCSEPLPSTACWAKFSRPFGTEFRK